MSGYENISSGQFERQSWEKVRDMHSDYANAEDLVTWAAHATPEDPEAENAHPYDLTFSREKIDVGPESRENIHIPPHLKRPDPTDPRISEAREGYMRGDPVPPVLAVRRNRRVLFPDGNHRVAAARGLSGRHENYGHYEVDAWVAKSPNRRRMPTEKELEAGG